MSVCTLNKAYRLWALGSSRALSQTIHRRLVVVDCLFITMYFITVSKHLYGKCYKFMLWYKRSADGGLILLREIHACTSSKGQVKAYWHVESHAWIWIHASGLFNPVYQVDAIVYQCFASFVLWHATRQCTMSTLTSWAGRGEDLEARWMFPIDVRILYASQHIVSIGLGVRLWGEWIVSACDVQESDDPCSVGSCTNDTYWRQFQRPHNLDGRFQRPHNLDGVP